jgi:hypothetical protein
MIRIVDNTLKFISQADQALDRTLNLMVIDIERLAKQQVPVGVGKKGKQHSAGQLKASGYHKRLGFKKYVIGFNKEYSAYQEWGGDGKRVVRKYSRPGKKKFYLRDPVLLIHSRAVTYFKKEIAKIKI